MSKREKLAELIAEAESQKERYPNNWGRTSYLASALDIITKDTVSFRSDVEELIQICCPEYYDETGKELQDFLPEQEQEKKHFYVTINLNF